jgi:hypothetical protein
MRLCEDETKAMSLFEDPQDGDKLCQVLKAYVGEFGAENVIVVVPKSWSAYRLNNLGKVRLQFTTENTVSIRVECGLIKISYCIQLRDVDA